MKKYDVIIIGAGPAGVVTGVTVKKQNSGKSVLIITEEEKGLIPCGIPYIFHHLGSVEKNMMGLKPFKDLGGEVIVDPVNEVKVKEKSVSLNSGDIYHYDKLVFATGSTPVIAKFIRGYEMKNVYYIKKSYSYIHRLFGELKDKKNIVIIGGGFIGAEVAEQLALHPDKKVTLIESEKYCFSKAFSEELSKIATEQLEKTATHIRTSTKAEEIAGNKDGFVEKVILKGGEEIAADAVIISVGYKPNSELAEKAGLPLNVMGAIKVDSYERTSVKDVSAVGDCSQTIGFLTGRSDLIMLASTATAEARVLGYNLFSVKIKKPFSGTLGIFSTKINGLAMAAAGIDERSANEANIDFLCAKFTDVDRHPGTIPGTSPITVKLYVSPSDGTVLGGEVWGSDSAGEIINIIGLIIQKSITIYELVSFQIGTHPLLTSAPTKPVIIKAAEAAISMIQITKKEAMNI